MSLKITVLIVDDQQIIIDGITSLLNSTPTIKIIGGSKNGKQAIEDIRKLDPDIVLLDFNMPEMDGIETLEKLKNQYPQIKVIMLTGYDEIELIREALRKGAKGYVLKNVDKAQLIVAIESVNNGGTFLDSNVQEKVIESFVKSNNNSSEKVETQINESRNVFELTRREIDVLRLIVEGKKSTDIGNKLFISINTVDTHRKNIMSKCNTKNVAELVKLALDKKLI